MDRDVRAVERAMKALQQSTNRHAVEANLLFLWDYFVAHPSQELPPHLQGTRGGAR